MVFGFKPQGKNRSIQANTRNPPQDPPSPPKPIKAIVKPVIIKETPKIEKVIAKPTVKVEKVIVQKVVPKIKKPLTLKQKIISFLKRVIGK